MKSRTITVACLVALLSLGMLAACSDDETTVAGSKEWRDRKIYFLMTDRFANGNTANDQQTDGGIEFGAIEAKWNGGDFAGLTARLDYIKGMGFDAIWITPPVLNQWWDAAIPYGGYHGYWASDFTNVDPHYGTLEEYKALVNACHDRDILVIQDIVCNHAGNYFLMDAEGGTLTMNPDSVPAYPVNALLSNAMVNYRDNGMSGMTDELNIFHWTPDLTSWSDPYQLTNFQASSLDDFNSENPLVLQKMKEWFRFWIREVGVDGFRIDTVKNVPKWWWRDFCYSTNAEHPGVKVYAEKSGKSDFFIFGEVHTPGDANEDLVAGGYTKDEAGNPILQSVLYYPMYSVIQEVFSKEAPTVAVKKLIDNLDVYYRSDAIPYLVSFIDNHDKTRFRSGNSREKMKLSLLFIYTSIGIPCVYYGTEQEFTISRPSMFQGGYQPGMEEKDYYLDDSDGYRFLTQLNNLRSKYEVLRRGTQTVLGWTESAPGILAYKRESGDLKALVIMNTARYLTYADKIQTGFGSNIELVNVLNPAQITRTEADGTVSTTVPSQTGIVLVPKDQVR